MHSRAERDPWAFDADELAPAPLKLRSGADGADGGGEAPESRARVSGGGGGGGAHGSGGGAHSARGDGARALLALPSDAALASLRVAELKELCRARSLPVSGARTRFELHRPRARRQHDQAGARVFRTRGSR
jgi:hypothetical protein